MEQPYTNSSDVVMLQSRIREMAKHMHHVGTLTIIMGAFACLSIIGALWGIPYIISGLRLRESAESYRGYAAMNDGRQLLTAFEKQSSSFFIIKVLMIIGLVFTALYILFLVVMLGFAGMDLFDVLDY